MEEKAFLANPKQQCPVSQCGEDDCSAINKKNGDHYKYPSLYRFIDEIWLEGKWSKEMFFFQIRSINIMYPNVEKHDCSAHNKKNWDYYKHPSLSHFTDKLWL